MESSDTKPNNLAELRARIDAVDDEIIELLLKRMALSTQVMQSKPRGQILDSKREDEIIKRYMAGLSHTSSSAKLQRLVRAILGASSLYPD